MVDTSDLILVIAALSMFGMILTNANRVIFGNQNSIVHIEHEAAGITLANEIIDDARRKMFNSALADGPEGNWPADFSTDFGAPAGATDLNDFYAWEHYHNYQDTVSTDQGQWFRSVEVHFCELDQPTEIVQEPTFHKRMVVTVEPLDKGTGVEMSSVRTAHEFYTPD